MAKAGRKTLLTPEVQTRIITLIAAGAFDHIAAEAAGISRHTFAEWIRRGEGADDRPPDPEFANFANKVREARAQARVTAEIEIKKKEPLAWLRLGPGRDKPGSPGWTEATRVEHTGSGGGPIQVQNFREEFVRRIERLAERSGGAGGAAAGGPPAPPLPAKRGRG